MANKRISVTKETSTGRNTEFRDNHTGRPMSRGEFADRIDSGEYRNYHVRVIDGKRTPVSNPDGKGSNNLG